MAKVTIVGNAVVVTSTLKLEDIRIVGKYCPEALSVYEGKDNEKEVFAIRAGNDEAFSKYGICFAQETRDENKYATITLAMDYNGDDVKEFVADRFGSMISNLNKLEETLPKIIEKIAAERSALMQNITVVE